MKRINRNLINRNLTVAAVVSLVAITGCGAQGGGSSAPPAASSAAPSADGPAQAADGVITIKDFKYEVPASVNPGSMVTVTNADSAPHTLTVKDEGGFDFEVPGGGTVIFAAPDAPGEYEIICSFHPQMSGTLVVK
ncbi:cupredoxin domain-containing protein [Arthrobacter sp. D3-16]